MTNGTRKKVGRKMAPAPKGQMVSTQMDLAVTCGVSIVTIQTVKRIFKYEKEPDGYDVDFFKAKLAQRRENNLTKIRMGAPHDSDDTQPGEDGDIRSHEIRYKKARADREEMKAAIEKGTQVDLIQVRQETISREMAFKKSFMNLPKNMATRLVGCGSKEIEAVLTKYVSEGFRKLANKGKLKMPNKFTGESVKEKKKRENLGNL